MRNEKRSKVLVFQRYLLRLAFLMLLQPNHNFTAGATQNQISTSAVQLNHTCDELNLNNRMSEIEARSRHQENEIGILKTLRVKDQKMINQLRDRVEQLESTAANAGANEKILERQKRPFRLAPINFLREDEKDTSISDEREKQIDQTFYGPATSCDELGKIGYTLNGYYIVKAKPQSIVRSSHTFEIVYCQFYQPLLGQLEDRLGYINTVKPGGSGIYFYVARHGDLPTASNGVLRFNKERLNIGGAMNLSTGVFTAPKDGVYHFSFSIHKEGFNNNFLDQFWIYLRLNGIKMGSSVISPGPMSAPTTAQFILKLKNGDRVDLWKPSSGTIGKCFGITAIETCNHFTGWLLEEIIEN